MTCFYNLCCGKTVLVIVDGVDSTFVVSLHIVASLLDTTFVVSMTCVTPDVPTCRDSRRA